MQNSGFTIRLEEKSDYREVEYITREAFWNHHVPGCDEHYLAHLLRAAKCFLPELDFVAELDGRLVGNIMYSRAVIRGDDGAEHPVLSFGPVSVLPDFQGFGIGSALIQTSLARAKETGHTAVLIYGDPEYYCRFGFVPAERFGIGTKYNTYADALQAIELIPGALSRYTGLFLEDPVYEIFEEDAMKFDAQFPPKERLTGLASQKKFQRQLEMQKARD